MDAWRTRRNTGQSLAKDLAPTLFVPAAKAADGKPHLHRDALMRERDPRL